MDIIEKTMESLSLINDSVMQTDMQQGDMQQGDMQDTTDNIINDMKSLSLDDAKHFRIDLFEHHMDIYSAYPSNYDTIPEIQNENIHKYKKLALGIPNVFCNKYFDDEDFIYSHLIFEDKDDFKNSNSLQLYVDDEDYYMNDKYENENENENDNSSNTIYEPDYTLVNFAETIYTPNTISAKVHYIYQFVKFYYSKTLYLLKPSQRVKHLPDTFIQWIDNLICIIRKVIDERENLEKENYKQTQMQNQIQNQLFYINQKTITKDYFDELHYGLGLTVCHLKMIINHHKFCKLHFWLMQEKYIEKLFTILHNLCVIVMFMNKEH
jgi:hypothetical protein